MEPRLTWNLLADLRELFAYEFMVNAFAAGTVAAVLAGVIGWFVVLRRESFAAHTLAVIGFPGAAGAALLGIPAAAGYLAASGLGALAMIPAVIAARRQGGQQAAAIGTVQAFAIALGFLFVTLGHRNLSTAQTLLFGSFLGITRAEVWSLLLIAAVLLPLVAWIGRPLFFASIDADVAAARGVPVRALTAAFVLVIGVTVAETSPITGSLLVFALLIIPAATAQAVTAQPLRGIALSVAIAVLVTWGGLATSYYANYPIGFTVTSYAFGLYVLVRAAGAAPRRAPSPHAPPSRSGA